MADAMMRLATQVELRFEVPPDVQADPTLTVQFVLLRLEEFMQRNAATLLQKLGTDRDRMSSDANLPEIAPRTLIILDNVDQPGLLAADQLKLMPQSEWFELVVTTRLDPERLGIGKDLLSIPVDSLPLDDSVALIRDFQPKQQFTNAEDEAGARRLCEILGGFTLSIELAAAYLGEHPDVRPGDYCNLLIQKGLPTADQVAAEDDVAGHIRHREKQLSVVTDWTLARLDERARLVLDHASLLEPDSIMVPWLRDIAAERYPELRDTESTRSAALASLKEILAAQDDGDGSMRSIANLLDDPETAAGVIQALRPSLDAMPQEMRSRFERILDDASLPVADRSQPNLWLAVWRQLKGLRVLTPSDDATSDVSAGANRVGGSVPAVARIHRLIAAHVKDGLSAAASEACWERLIRLTDQRAFSFQESWRHSALDHWMVRPFGDNALHLARQRPQSRVLAMACGVIGQAEMTLGSLARAEQLIRQSSDNLRLQYNSDQTSEQTGRVLSVSLIDLGDFYRARGQAGDAERALTQFEESLQIRKQLFEANPNSAQAARDLLVSQERLSDLAGSSDAADAASRALELQSQALQLALALHQANPASASVGQDAADSAIRTARKAHAAGQEEIASQSLGVCYSVLHTLVQNGCELNQTMTNLFQQLQRTLGNSAQEDAT
jgi:tetratricopeptide (TPR) repeat protein